MGGIAHKELAEGFYLYIDERTDNSVTYHFDGDKKSHTAKLCTTLKGRVYFRVMGDTYYLDDFEKVGDE